MKNIFKVLLAFCSVILGVYIFVIAYTTPLHPYWLNTIWGVFGFALMAGGATYVFVKVINKIVK